MTDLAQILDEVEHLLLRFVVFANRHQVVALSLWVAHTWALEHAESTPYINLKSPAKQAGKTRTIEVLKVLVRSPCHQTDMSEAWMFRELDENESTLLLDEVDGIFGAKARDNEGLRCAINAGHRRGATVGRCEPQGKKIVRLSFNVFSAKVLAGLGSLPDTIADRSILIELRRKMRREPIERFRRRNELEFVAVREALEAWAGSAELEADPELPEELSDRAQDGWEPLLAISDAAGAEWPARARLAAVALHAQAEDDDLGVKLLSDIRAAFLRGAVNFTGDYISGVDILEHLNDLEGSPWGDWKGKPMTPQTLGRFLKPFGIKTEQRRNGAERPRAYWWDRFHDPWERWLSPPPEGEFSETSEPQPSGEAQRELEL